jgi:membrane associated rhomboid family serine protease
MSERDYSNAITAFNSVMVGASGAIYGVLVAFAFSFPNSKLMLLFLPFPIKAKFFVPLLILIDLFFGISSFSVGPIAHFAHVGGAIIGLIMVLYWRKNQFNDRRWD